MDADTLKTEMQAVFDAVAASFEVNDFVTLKTLWDSDDPAPFYLAEEHEVLVSDWGALCDYWALTTKVNAGCSLRWQVAAAKLLTPDHAACMFTLDWKILITGMAEPYGGFNRGQAVLRRTDGGWRFRTYVEAPLAPITYLKKLYVETGRRAI